MYSIIPLVADPEASEVVAKATGHNKKLAAAEHTRNLKPSQRALDELGGKDTG